MRLNDFEEVEKQKHLLDKAMSLLEGLETANYPIIKLILGTPISMYIEQSLEDDAFRTMLMDCLRQFADVVKQRLIHLGVEL